MTKILYIGKHPEILETVVRLINANENWFGIGAENETEAVDLFFKYDFSIVLLGCGLSFETEQNLTATFSKSNPKIHIIEHFGGGSGLLKNEILSALSP